MPKPRIRSNTNLPMNSSCFLCNIEIPGDSKDLFEHFRSVHFITTEPAKDTSIFEQSDSQDDEEQHCLDLEELSFNDIAMECGELALEADVSKWTSEDVARKLKMEAFDQSVIDTFKDEEIDGTSLLMLTRDDLNELKLKLGHKKKVERLIESLKNKPPETKKQEEHTASNSIAQPSMSMSTIETFPNIAQTSVFSPNVPVSSPNFPVSSASFAESSPANYSISSDSVSVLPSDHVLSSEVYSSASCSVILPTTNLMVSSPITLPLPSCNVSVCSPSVIPVSVAPIMQPLVTHKIHMQQLPNIDSSSSPSHRTEKSIFNVKEMILSTKKGRAVYEEYLARGKSFLTVPERRTIVFVVVDAMVNELGLYPTTHEKDMLAAAIIEAFPCLGIRDGNNLIHSHYYHAKSGGFIETLLKTMRKKQPECRKRKVSSKQKMHRKIPRGYIEDYGPEMEEEEIQMHEFMVRLLKSLIPTASNADQINDAMESTFSFRQYQMKKNLKTPSLILAEYPRMVDFNNGLLIFDDFKRKYPSANDIEQSFIHTYGDRLIYLAEKEMDALPVCSNDFLRLLLICIFIMPEIKKIRKNTVDEKVQQLIFFISENRNLQDFVALRSREQINCSPYPYLVGVGTMTDPVYFNLVIDGNIIPCGSDCLTAFKNLFASYFVFQLHYPVLIKPLLKFFEERVFRLTPTMTATTADFVARLESIPR